MAQCRNGCKAALLNGALYVVGGHDGFSYLDTVEAFHFQGNSWEVCAPMSIPRGFGCCTVIDGMLYVFGGTSGNANEDNMYHSEMERYDPRQNLWSKMAPMHDARAYFASVVLNNCIYAIGGFNGRWLNTVEKYDPQTNRWQYVRELSIPRSSFSATVHDGYVYVAGGFTGKANVNTVERYDPCRDRWGTACGMPMNRYGLQLVNVQIPCRK
ncbi:kelch-like protein 28 [Amphiura filiformis]|uniref:kelch-like protein 28 n=1 Tax=Amphiura filiformis TaxID=82378 RepID=UPI003B21F73D